MGNLKEQLKTDLKNAMKSKNNFDRDVIRMLMSSIKQVEVDERKEVNDAEIIKIIQKSVKQREDAASQYREANRADLYEKEEKEAELLKRYLPAQLSDDELKKIISEVIKKSGASSIKEMGKVMQGALKVTEGKADGKRVSVIVKELLN